MSEESKPIAPGGASSVCEICGREVWSAHGAQSENWSRDRIEASCDRLNGPYGASVECVAHGYEREHSRAESAERELESCRASLSTAEKESARLTGALDACKSDYRKLRHTQDGLTQTIERLRAKNPYDASVSDAAFEAAHGITHGAGKRHRCMRCHGEFECLAPGCAAGYDVLPSIVRDGVVIEHDCRSGAATGTPSVTDTAPAANKASDSSALEKALGALRAIMRLARCDVGHETTALDQIYDAGWHAIYAALPDPSGGAHVDGPKAQKEEEK